MFNAVRLHSTLEETVEQLARAIRARLLSPGEKLPSERALSRQLGVSRSTVRACLHALCEAGYLHTRSGRNGGTFVTRWPGKPSADTEAKLVGRRAQLVAQLDLRRAVEPTVAELAARRARLIDVAELEGRYYSMVGTERDFERYRARDVRFHVGIAQVSDSPRLLEAVTDVQLALTDVLDVVTYRAPHLLHRSNEDHGLILEAIRHRDPGAARRCMLEHVQRSERLVYAYRGWAWR